MRNSPTHQDEANINSSQVDNAQPENSETVIRNENLQSNVDTVTAENNIIQNIEDDTLQTENETEIHKNELSESNICIGTYLRSEFIGLNAQEIEDIQPRLPKYREIDMIGHSSKKRNEKDAKQKKSKRYRNRTVTVHFMGSENIPEEKVAMEYDPEGFNGPTLTGIFVMLMLFHWFNFVFTMLLFLTPVREGLITHGHYAAIPAFFALFLLVIIAACFGICRNIYCNCCLNFWALVFTFGFYGSLSGYIGKRFLCFNTLSLTVTDMFFCIVANRSNFDFTDKMIFPLGVIAGTIAMILTMPGLHIYCTWMAYYWGSDEFPQETWLSFLLTILFTFFTIVVELAQLQLFLKGEEKVVEVGETDFTFGAYLMFVSLIDFPIRLLRKKGLLDSCGGGGGEEE